MPGGTYRTEAMRDPANELPRTPLWRSSHSGDSAKFAYTEFYEVRTGLREVASCFSCTNRQMYRNNCCPVPVRSAILSGSSGVKKHCEQGSEKPDKGRCNGSYQADHRLLAWSPVLTR